MSRQYHYRFGMAALAGMVSLGGAAQAQQAAGANVLEEIVVTAQRRAERLQDVPIAMTVTTQEQIQRDQIYSLNDLQRLSPTLEVNRTFGGENNGGARIRGLGTASFTGIPSVTYVIDGVPQGDLVQTNIFDIAQIEILRGPQGTLFGQNASAGVISQVTVTPDPDKFSASGHLDVSEKDTLGSDFGRQLLRGAVNIPVSETSAVRVAAFGTRNIGTQHNTYTGHDNKFTDSGVRARYLLKPTDYLTINVIGDYTANWNHGNDFFTLAVAPSPSNGNAALVAACGITPGFGNQDFCFPDEDSSSGKNYGLSASFDLDLDAFKLSSVSAWRKSQAITNRFSIQRLNGAIPNIFNRNTISDHNQFVQELRISSPSGSKVDYVGGVYFQKAEAKASLNGSSGGFNLLFPWPDFAPPCVFGGACSIVDSFTPNSTTTTSKAVFGDATVHITDAFKAFAGLRYTDQKIEGVNGPVMRTVTDNNVSGRVGVAYNFTADLMAYASAARGYKSPFIQVFTDPSIPANVIKGEIPTAYELGVKASFLDGRLGVDANVFYVDVKDFQGQQCTINPANSSLICAAINIKSVVSKGIELDVLGNPVEGIRLNSGFIYNPVEYPDNWTGSDGTNISNKQLALSPVYKWTLSAEFSRPLGGVEGFLSVNPVWKSKIRFNDSTNPVFEYKAHWQLGASLGVRGADNKWSASLFARNLTDNHEPTVIFGNDDGSGLQGWPFADVSLRQVGISLDAKF